jgi:hypothetical protein
MTEPITEHLTSRTPSDGSAAALEPPWALSVGGIAGATGFFLFAMFFGIRWAIVAAVVGAIVALVKREWSAAIAFVIAGALAAIGLAPSTTVLFFASLAFGAGLALAARVYARTHASGAES